MLLKINENINELHKYYILFLSLRINVLTMVLPTLRKINNNYI